MSFLLYDIVFLVLFVSALSIFLYKRRDNLKREGLLYLYRTSWGIKLIDKIGKKYKKTLNVLSYVSVVSGYILMVGMFYLTYTIIKIYFFSPDIVRAIRVPPIMPLFPYLPQAFKLDFLPPFYFTYFIVIIAIIAITHEMAHGIFMRRYNIKIKSTGFGFFPFFLPVFLAAFVEQDEKSMNKAGNFQQRAVLSAGTFANILTAAFFLIILMIFFTLAFTASGIVFNTYATSKITVAGISSINGIQINGASYETLLEFAEDERLNELVINETSYLATKSMLEGQKNKEDIIVYHSAPAIKENLSSVILEIEGEKITSIDMLVEELSKYSPGDEITLKTVDEESAVEKTLVLEEHPEMPGSPWLGIGFIPQERKGLMGNIIKTISFRESNVYYEPKFDGLSIFIYNLFWWLVLISLSVALINMLPVGIFDGGRFFYLTIFSLTKNEKLAKGFFVFFTQLFIFLLLALMILWAVSFIR